MNFCNHFSQFLQPLFNDFCIPIFEKIPNPILGSGSPRIRHANPDFNWISLLKKLGNKIHAKMGCEKMKKMCNRNSQKPGSEIYKNGAPNLPKMVIENLHKWGCILDQKRQPMPTKRPCANYSRKYC